MNQRLDVVVDGLWRQGARSLAVKLVSANGTPLPPWQPGAHIDLHLPGGVVRPYSLTGSHRAEGYLVCVGREHASRGGSRYVHDTLRPGQRLTISPPRNLFPLQAAGRVVLLAAGIGITPLYAMALALEQAATPYVLHYYLKKREDAAFLPELMQAMQHGQVHVHSSADGHSPRTRLAQDIGLPQDDAQLYACGPQGFMAQVRDCALQSGWQAEQLHSEAFQPAAAPLADPEENLFTITLAASGESWPVPPDQSIAQVLQAQGVAVPLSCEMGICGACLTRVVEGEADHRDTVQSAAEKCADVQQIALCCSRSRSANLVIDLAR